MNFLKETDWDVQVRAEVARIFGIEPEMVELGVCTG